MRKRLYDHIFCLDDSLRLDCEYIVWYDSKGEVVSLEVEAASLIIYKENDEHTIEPWKQGGHLEDYLMGLEYGTI